MLLGLGIDPNPNHLASVFELDLRLRAVGLPISKSECVGSRPGDNIPQILSTTATATTTTYHLASQLQLQQQDLCPG